MALPAKIPECHHVKLGICPRSNVVISRDDDEAVAFLCKQCGGLQVFTKDKFTEHHRRNKKPIIIKPPTPFFDMGREAGKIR